MVEDGRGEGSKTFLGGVLKKALGDLGPDEGGLDDREVDAISELCLMTFVPTGQEDPRGLLREMSDALVEHIVSQLPTVKDHPVVGKICQFFLVEWCYRNGHLNGDWVWQWNGPASGQLHYDPKIPLSMVSLPGQSQSRAGS